MNTLYSFKMGNQWRSDTVSQAGIPEPSKWLWKPQNSHPSPHSQELAAGLCHKPDKSTQPVYHQFTTLFTSTLRSFEVSVPFSPLSTRIPHKCFMPNLPHPPWINQWRPKNMKILIICHSLNLFNFLTLHQRTSRSLTLLTFTCAAVRVHNILVWFLLDNSPASEFYMPTLQHTLSVPSS
jgi:hypothetical protein